MALSLWGNERAKFFKLLGLPARQTVVLSSEDIVKESTAVIPYPWHQKQWQHFLEQCQQQRLPHAILLSGSAGIGKKQLAEAMANYLLCQTPQSGLPCGGCRGCRLLRSMSHPDKHLIYPEEKARQIKVDQLRELSSKICETAQQGGRKIVIIEPTECLNINAANALLKSLEEPAGNTVFILISHSLSMTLPTIRSRCQLIKLPIPDRQLTSAWLSQRDIGEAADGLLWLASGAPLKAVQYFEDAVAGQLSSFYKGLAKQSDLPVANVSLASEWQTINIDILLDWWLQLVHRLILQQQNWALPQSEDTRSELIMDLQTLLKRTQGCKSSWLHRFYDKLLTIKKQYLQGANPNRQLLLEELLLDWYAITRLTNQLPGEGQ
ncbi:MAG: DNA polymerase-3 subunit delta' [Cellvibrionaceae bacterium]|jgi:DNA polymerase-3 subunit delta'